MLKSLWTAISVLALANLLGLLIFVGWLKSTDRLSKDRVEAVRMVFAQTVSTEVAKKEAEAAVQEQQALKAQAEAKAALPPVTAELRAAIIREHEEKTRQDKQRIQRETENLIETLTRQQAQFERERMTFRAEKEAFEKQRAEIARLEGDAQFQKSLKVYQSLKPDVAKSMFQRLIEGGRTGEVVTYLNGMKPSAVTKIITEFQKADASMAADLLERLKVHGMAVGGVQEFRNDAGSAESAGANSAGGGAGSG